MTVARPAFDPAVYESAELAELNRPIHALCWDMIDLERELDAARKARVSATAYEPLEARYFAARKAHTEAVDALDVEVDAYCARVEAAGGLDAYLGRADPVDDRQHAFAI